MATVGMSSGLGGAFGSTFASGAPSVAALDTPQLSQTKAEIRTLVAEIAELSAADIDTDQFMRGMLSRICMAMGATAAAVWTVGAEQSLELCAGHNLSAALDAANETAAAAHGRVLACVAAEGQPILVPPGSIRIEAERPSNPIDEALLVVPIRIHDRVDALLEVIQPGGGGPAAQRGYLRFVAQMADLLADYLRRHKLRQLASEAEYVRELQQQILAVCAAGSPEERWQAVATAVSRLMSADMALLLSKPGRRWRVRAISELRTFDPRSETVAVAERCLGELERRGALANDDAELLTEAPLPTATPVTTADPAALEPAESMRGLLSCDRLFRLSLAADGHYQVLLAIDRSDDRASVLTKARQLIPALGALLTTTDGASGWSKWLPSFAQPSASRTHKSWRAKAERFVVRASTIGLVAAVACFPTPDQVAVVAVLEAEEKQMYYAPAAATIERVLVDSGQSVKAGDVLLELSDKQLEAELNEVAGQRLTADTQLAQDTAALKRGQQSPQQLDELESRMVQSKITISALDERLAILNAQAARLKISARDDSVVTTWDARNRLQGRPVAAGQLLIATCVPEANWRLQLSIDQQKAGMVQDALAASEGGLPVHFSLSSHPSDVRTGRLIRLSQQLLNDDDGSAKVLGTVLVDAQSLPAKTDGAVARAAIDCGRVTATWFVLRDAYREASAWLRMTW